MSLSRQKEIRPVKRSRTVIALLVLAIGAAGGAAVAQSESPGSSALAPDIQPIGGFTVADTIGYPSGHAFAISVPSGTQVQSAMVTIPPGFDFGWHHHTGAVVVEVTSGTVTLYDTKCERQDVTAGQGFLEEVNTVHRARNETTESAVLVVTYLGVPAGEPTDVPEQAPCDIGASPSAS
jgi:quercetin dioxygenase-like cupin family protein